MSEENILISKARYDDIMERLKKYDDQKHKSDDVESDESNEKEDGMKSVAYGNLVGYLIEAVKDQQKQIDELKAQINDISN